METFFDKQLAEEAQSLTKDFEEAGATEITEEGLEKATGGYPIPQPKFNIH